MLARNIYKNTLRLFSNSFAPFSLSSTQTSHDKIRTPIAQKPGTGSTRHVTLIPGYGIGPEVTGSVRKIFEAANCPIEWDVIDNFCIANPQCFETINKNECILMGTLPSQEETTYVNNELIYKKLDLYANLTYGRTLPGVETRHKNIDIAVIRENTEGEYSGLEHEVYPGVVESIKVITKPASLRVAEYAFEFAHLSGRKKVTAVHKANIMKLCDGMFLEATREVAQKYPFIEYEEMIIDNCTMQVVKDPWQFDVMLLPNLYGSIISNTIAGLCGGSGITSGVNIGEKHAIFEQGTRRTGRDIAGQGIANPTALILSSVIMLKHLDLVAFAHRIEKALEKTYKNGTVRTPDLGGTYTTEQFTQEVIKNLREFN